MLKPAGLKALVLSSFFFIKGEMGYMYVFFSMNATLIKVLRAVDFIDYHLF